MARFNLVSVICFSLIFLTHCSSISKLAIRSQSGIFEKSSDVMFYENDLDWFAETTPANIKLMETFYWSDPGNTRLLKTLIKAYSGYAFAILETQHLENVWSGKETEISRQRASSFYQRALDYSWTFLKSEAISHSDVMKLDESELKKLLKKRLSESDLDAVFFMAQAWGSLINLNQKDIALVSEVPRVKILFDYLCEMDRNWYHGTCDIFAAQYESSRPKMLGGDPVKGKKMFKDFLTKNPGHFLGRAQYAQVVLVPSMEVEEFDEIIKDIPTDEYKNPTIRENSQNIFQAIGIRRLKLMQKYRQNLF